MNDLKVEERTTEMKLWQDVFKKAVFPILNRELNFYSFSCVEGTQLDLRYDIDYFLENGIGNVSFSVRGRREDYNDVTLRQAQFLKMKLNKIEKDKGKSNVFAEYFLYYTARILHNAYICKRIYLWKTLDVLEAATILDDKNELRWGKVDNAFALVPRDFINEVARKNGNKCWVWENEEWNIVRSSRGKPIMANVLRFN